MNPLDFTSLFWPMLTRATFHGSAALIAVFVICRLFPRIPAAAKCWLWRLAWLRVILAFATGAGLELPILPAPRSVTHAPTTILTQQLPPSVDAAPISSAPAVSTAPSIEPTEVLALIWALGAALMILRLAVHFIAVKRLRRDAIRKTSEQLAALSTGFNVTAPTLLIAERITKPLLTGIWKPAIILPVALSDADPRTLELIFKHELAHLKRRDLAWNWLAAIAHTLFWFNPLTWICERESNFNQEVACDQLALQSEPSRAAEFASLLIDIAANRERRPQLLTVSIIRTANTLERRLKAMKTLRTKGSFISIALALLALTPALVPWRAIAQKSDAATTAETQTEAATSKGNVDEEFALEIKLRRNAEIELLAEEIKLAREQLNAATRAREQGRAGLSEVVQRQRELLQLERELAMAQKDRAKARELLEEELKAVEQLQREGLKQFEAGRLSSDEKLKVDREVLKLKRELAALDRPEETPSRITPQMLMQNPELMKRYFPQMYAYMMESKRTNAPALSEQLRAARDELSMLRLKYKDTHPAVREAQNKVATLLRKSQALEEEQVERRRLLLHPKRPGVVRAVLVKAGDRVSEGQNLVLLDDREARLRLQGAEAEYAVSQADIKLQQKTLESERRRIQDSAFAHELKQESNEIIALKMDRLANQLRLAQTKLDQARLEIEDLTIRAPTDGVVVSTPLVGGTVSPDITIVEFIPAPLEKAEPKTELKKR